MAVCWDGVVAAVTVTGEVDCSTAPALASRLLEVAAEHPERLVLDLDGLFFTDVASARALDSAYKALDKKFPSHPASAPALLRPQVFGITRLTGRSGGAG